MRQQNARNDKLSDDLLEETCRGKMVIFKRKSSARSRVIPTNSSNAYRLVEEGDKHPSESCLTAGLPCT